MFFQTGKKRKEKHAAMKLSYRKPQMYSFPNLGGLTNRQAAALTDEEFARYMERSKRVEYGKVYRANPDVLMRKMCDEAILVPVGKEITMNGLIDINSTVQFLWEQFQTPRTIPQVLARAQEEYEDEDGCMEREIRSFVKDYVSINFIREEENYETKMD